MIQKWVKGEHFCIESSLSIIFNTGWNVGGGEGEYIAPSPRSLWLKNEGLSKVKRLFISLNEYD